jgi:hypothetical protein
MLKLDLKLTKEQKTVRIGKIRDKFSTYFGFVTSGSIAEALALNQAISDVNATTGDPNSARAAQIDQARGRAGAQSSINRNALPIFELFLDSGSGARKTFSDRNKSGDDDYSIIAKLNQHFTGQQDRISEYRKYVEMHYCQGNNPAPINSGDSSIFHPDLNVIGFGITEEDAKAKLSAFRMNHPLLAAGERNADLLTIFFNAFPTLELVRATPVLDVRMYSSRKVFQDGRLAAISLQKFLEGAVEAEADTPQNKALRAIGLASQITASAFGNTDLNFTDYSITGMELFRAPQTMVNPDATRIKNNFLAPIIDPFRPLASIKSLDVDVRSAVGLISTKTAKLEIVLHDRSRLGEFADMVKPDRFGSSFVDVEYGWSHPDQTPENPNQDGNPYADILNLTRLKEHYNITNSSFSFDEVGQVNITLNLVTRGVSEMSELSITGNQDTVKAILTDIENISKEINQLSAVVFGNSNQTQNTGAHTHRSEIRANQMLGAVGDATNMLVVSGELLRSLNRLRESLHGSNLTGVRRDAALRTEFLINSLLGNSRRSTRTVPVGAPASGAGAPASGAGAPAPGAGAPAPGAGAAPAARQTRQVSTGLQQVGGRIAQVQQNINENVRSSLRSINRTEGVQGNDFEVDIFFKKLPDHPKGFFTVAANTRRTENRQRVSSENRANIDAENAQLNRPTPTVRSQDIRGVISLGTIFMNFVAKPLAMIQDKFEEVQVYFYNFNHKASVMSHCNISQFPIYTDFFAREYARLRLENMNRSVNLSVVDFVNFLANKMVDDPLNPAYGINNLYKLAENGRELEIVGSGNNDEAKQDDFNQKMRTAMETNNIGRSPDFQMPQITVDIESLPYYGDEHKTILKIHVYDKACSSSAPLKELLSLSTENLMAQLSSFPADAQAQQASLEQNDPSRRTTNNQHTRHGTSHHTQRRPASTAQQPQPISNDLLRENWSQIYSIVVQQAKDLKLIEEVQHVQNEETRRANITSRNPQYRFIGGPKRLKEMVMRYVPHIIYGCMGTTVKTANLSTQQNAQIATINMQRSLNADPVAANGEQAGGVPLSIYPCELSITTLGCPFIRHSQELFVDFNTNTTADNIYYVTGLSHKIEAGNYETTIKLTPNDAFAQYRNLISQLNNASVFLNSALSTGNTAPNNTTGQQSSRDHSRISRR